MLSGLGTLLAKSRGRAPYPSTRPPRRASHRRPSDVAESAANAHVDGRHNIVVQAIGSGINVSVDPRIPHLRLTHFEARTKRAGGDGADAALLSAYRTDVVPLLGRDHAIQDLQHWIAGDLDMSIRVLTGGAGRGRTPRSPAPLPPSNPQRF